jgi:hypothetical protein
VGQHDLSYRLFFAYRRMIQDLLREIVGEQWVERIDLDSGERVDASFVSPKHENRESDVIWQFRRKDGGEPVYISRGSGSAEQSGGRPVPHREEPRLA